MSIQSMLYDLKLNAWVFEAWSEHLEDGKTDYYVKLTCGVQARGRVASHADTFEKALAQAHDLVMTKWGKV